MVSSGFRVISPSLSRRAARAESGLVWVEGAPPSHAVTQFRSGSGFCMCQCTRLCSGGLVFITG